MLQVRSFVVVSRELFIGDFDATSFADLVGHHDIVGDELLPRHGIALAVPDPISGLAMDLMESDLRPFRSRRDPNLIPHQHSRTIGLVATHGAATNCLDVHQFTDRVAEV